MTVTLRVIAPSLGSVHEIRVNSQATFASLKERVYSMTGFSIDSISMSIDGEPIENYGVSIEEVSSSDVVEISVDGKVEFKDIDENTSVRPIKVDEEEMEQHLQRIRQSMRAARRSTSTPPEGIYVDMNCQVTMNDGNVRTGVVKYIGIPEGRSAYMVGVKLNGPYGKNDGSANGVRYFTCGPNEGVFVKPEKVVPVTQESDDEF